MNSYEFPGVELADGTSPAGWIEEGLWPWNEGVTKVGNVIPPGFEAYARILHPAFRQNGDMLSPVRWSEVTEWSGGKMHPEVAWPRFAGSAESGARPYDLSPDQDTLPHERALGIGELLAEFTSLPNECWFCLWTGFGFLKLLNRSSLSLPIVHCPSREYLLYSGTLESLDSFWHGPRPHRPWSIINRNYQSPNYWWPNDVSWCVATPIDIESSFIGGGTACIDKILASDEFEALPVGLDSRLDYRGDHFNQ